MQSRATLFRGTETSIRRLLLLLALLFAVTATGLAKIDITNVVGNQEKRKNSATRVPVSRSAGSDSRDIRGARRGKDRSARVRHKGPCSKS